MSVQVMVPGNEQETIFYLQLWYSALKMCVFECEFPIENEVFGSLFKFPAWLRKKKNKPNSIWRNGLLLRALSALWEGPSSILGIHIMAHDCLWLQF